MKMKGFKGMKLGFMGAAAVVLALVAGLLLTAQVSAQEAAVSDATGVVGEEVTVDVVARDIAAPGLGAWSIDITYDPFVATATACSGISTCNPAFENNVVRVAGADAFGLEGDTTLATITFECGADEGLTALTVTLEVFNDAEPGVLNPIAGTALNGTLICEMAPPPEPTATEVPPAEPTATEGPAGAEPTATTVVTGPPGTGTGGASDGSGLSWLIAALAGVGLAGIAGFGALRLRARRS